MTISQILLAIARIINAVISYLNDSAQRGIGETRAMARSLKEQWDRVQKARAARNSVIDDRMPDDDPYRRD